MAESNSTYKNSIDTPGKQTYAGGFIALVAFAGTNTLGPVM